MKKRILAAIMTCAILLSALAVTSFSFTGEVGNVSVPKLGCDDIIVIDGNIDTGTEFWGETTAVNLNDSNTTTAWNYRARVVTNTDIRFAYSNEGIYISALTFDDSPIKSTGHEMAAITGEDDNQASHGFNGDTIILAFDPLQTMVNSYTEWANYSQKSPAWYCFTLNADGTTGVYRAKLDANNKDMTGIIEAAAMSAEENYWTLEAFIPWTELAESLNLATEGNWSVDPEACAQSGVVHNAKFIYMNRYAYNQNDGTDYSGMFLGYPDTGTVVTICRNYTVSNKIPGTSYNGTDGNPEQARTSGIYLNLVDNTDDDSLHTPAAEPEVIESTCTEQGKSTIYCTRCREILSREYLELTSHNYVVTDESTGKQKCTVCDKTVGAVINGTVPYDTFSEAYAAASAGDSIKVYSSETISSTLALDKAMTIDIGGNTISCESGPVFEISAYINFVNTTGTNKVTGNGVDTAVVIVSGTTTVDGGRFNGNGVAVFDVASGASLVINEGQIRSVADGLTSHFIGDGSIVIYGGTFRGADPSVYLAPCHVAAGVTDETEGYTEYTVAAEHIPGEIEEVAPTCTDDGYRKAVCTQCGELAIEEVIPALGHTPGEVEEVAPTCTEQGYRKAVCTVCGGMAVDEVIPAAGHTPGEEQTVEVSCTVDGAVYTLCVVCNEIATYEVTVPATGHSYKLTIIDPTCTQDGAHSFVCSCGESRAYVIPATGHTWSEWEVTAESTCNKEGEEARACSVCNITEVQSIPATCEHTYGEWLITEEPTVFTNGEQSRVCEVCQYIETEELDKLEMTNPFKDIAEGKWYTEGVLYCYHKGYMDGMSEDVFGYKVTVTRAMFATILAKIDGVDLSAYTSAPFDDVADGKWYTAAIAWAAENEYAAGIGEGVFGYKNDVTREQLAMFFYVYSGKNGVDVSGRADLSGYSDNDRIHEWALDAMAWAVDVGLISGTSETTVSPRVSATRAEIALIVMNYVEYIKNA